MTRAVSISVACFFGLVLLSVPLTGDQQSGQSVVSAQPVTTYRATLDEYCVTCHNERAKTAGLTLDNLNLDDVPSHAETWEKVIRKLRAGMMPPSGMPRRTTRRQMGSRPGSSARSIVRRPPTPIPARRHRFIA
jgi:mono/diheme cytochrome c family protein